jgi:hypothetical protein
LAQDSKKLAAPSRTSGDGSEYKVRADLVASPSSGVTVAANAHQKHCTEIKMTMKEYNSVKETLERLLPEDSKLRRRILSEFYEARRKIAKIRTQQ